MNNDARLNNLIYRTNNIVPYTPKILKADEYIKSKLFIITNGINIYGDSKNVSIFADETVLPGTTGPILHFYGKGGKGSSIGITFDTFESFPKIYGGRYGGSNPATKILAIDNGEYSSDLVFYTSPPSLIQNNLPESEERMRITSSGNINILKDLNIYGNTNTHGPLNTYNILNAYSGIYANSTLNVVGLATMANLTITGNLTVTGKLTVNNLEIILTELNIGELRVDGPIYIYGTADIYDNAIFHKNVDIKGNLLVEESVTIEQNLTVENNSNFINNISVNGTSNLNSNLIVGGTANFKSKVFLSNDLEVFDNTEIHGNLTIDGNSTFNQDSSFNANIIVSGLSLLENNVIIYNNLGVTGAINNVNLYGDSINKNFFMGFNNGTTGGITGSNNTIIGGSYYVNNYNYSTAIGYNSTFTDNHQIVMGTSGEYVYIPSNKNSGATNSGGLVLAGGANIGKDLIVNGTGFLNNLNVGGTGIINNLDVPQYLNVGGTGYIGGLLSLGSSGGLSVNGSGIAVNQPNGTNSLIVDSYGNITQGLTGGFIQNYNGIAIGNTAGNTGLTGSTGSTGGIGNYTYMDNNGNILSTGNIKSTSSLIAGDTGITGETGDTGNFVIINNNGIVKSNGNLNFMVGSMGITGYSDNILYNPAFDVYMDTTFHNSVVFNGSVNISGPTGGGGGSGSGDLTADIIRATKQLISNGTLNVSKLSSLVGGVTGTTANFNNLTISGVSKLNGGLTVINGISSDTLTTSSTTTINGLLYANNGITGTTANFNNLNANSIIGGSANINGILFASGGITGSNGTFQNLSIINGITGNTLNIGGTATIGGDLIVKGGLSGQDAGFTKITVGPTLITNSSITASTLSISTTGNFGGLLSTPAGITGSNAYFNGVTGNNGNFQNLASNIHTNTGLLSVQGSGITGNSANFQNLTTNTITGNGTLSILSGITGSNAYFTGITGITGNFQNLTSNLLTNTGLLSSIGGITVQGIGITGNIGNFQTLIGSSITSNGLLFAPGGITGSSAILQNLGVYQGITSYSLNVGNNASIIGTLSVGGGITVQGAGISGNIGNFQSLSTNTFTSNGLLSCSGGLTGSTGFFNNLTVSGTLNAPGFSVTSLTLQTLNVTDTAGINNLGVTGNATFKNGAAFNGDINCCGNINIGSTGTKYKINCAGDITTNSNLSSSNVLTNNVYANVGYFNYIYLVRTLTSPTPVVIQNGAAPSPISPISITPIGCPYVYPVSDYRLKEDIEILDNSYNVDNLNPVIFTLTTDNSRQTGLIAHEVQEFYPYLVTGEKDGEEYQTMNYIGLMGILIKEIQELKKENKKLKNDIINIKKYINLS